jgi:hypothetical protein
MGYKNSPCPSSVSVVVTEFVKSEIRTAFNDPTIKKPKDISFWDV